MSKLPVCVDEAKLEEYLRKSSVTDGWDAVFTCTLERLNPFIQNAYPSLAKPRPLRIQLEDDALGLTYTFELQLGGLRPEWQIEQDVLYAIFEIPIVSCQYWISSGTTIDDFDADDEAESRTVSPNKFFLRCKVHQDDIKGTYYHGTEEVKSKLSEEPQNMLNFGSVSTSTEGVSAVLIEFLRGHSTIWSIEAFPSAITTEFDVHFLKTASKKIMLWFDSTSMRGLRLLWTDGDNWISGPSTGTNLAPFSPERFIITATGSDKGGIISVWIKVRESGNGTGNPRPIARTASSDPNTVGEQICLLPANRSVSIIFGRQFFLGKILYNSILSALSQGESAAQLSVLACESGFKFTFTYGKDDIYMGIWKDGKPYDLISTETLQFDNETYNLDMDSEGSITVSRTADHFKNKIVTYRLSISKTFSNVFKVQDMHDLRHDPVTVVVDDFSVALKELHWPQTHYSPEGEHWRYQKTNFKDFTIRTPTVGIRPFCSTLGSCLARDITWHSSVKFPQDVFIVGDAIQRRSSQRTQDSASATPAPLVPIIGTPYDFNRHKTPKGIGYSIIVGMLGPLVEEEKPKKSYFAPFFENEEFLLLFLLAAGTTSTLGLQDIAGHFKVPFPAPNFEDVVETFRIGEHFDPRLVAGTYEIKSPDDFELCPLFIDTLSKPPRVFLNNTPASSVTVMEAGCHLGFTIEHPGTDGGSAERCTVSFSLIFSFHIDSLNKPISFKGTVSTSPAEGHAAEVKQLTGYQVQDHAYVDFVANQKEWGFVKFLACEYCLWGVIVWLCVNASQMTLDDADQGPAPLLEIDRTSRAWQRLQDFAAALESQEIDLESK